VPCTLRLLAHDGGPYDGRADSRFKKGLARFRGLGAVFGWEARRPVAATVLLPGSRVRPNDSSEGDYRL
jgi:hypothetical protein